MYNVQNKGERRRGESLMAEVIVQVKRDKNSEGYKLTTEG